jgi:hypothetical protein
MAAVKKLLSLYPDDPDVLDPHELQPGQAKEIAKLAGSRLGDDPRTISCKPLSASKGQRKRERVTAP